MNVSEVGQHLVNGVVNGSFYGLLGAGFGLILGVTGRLHLAFGLSFVLAAYIASTLTDQSVPLLIAVIGGIAVGTLLGPAIEQGIYRPLVARATLTGLLSVFVAALAVTVIGENLIRLIWGAQSRTLPSGIHISRISLGGTVGLTTFELLLIGICWAAIVVVWLYLRQSRSGMAIRAVETNSEMASLVGVSPRKVFLLVFVIGSALASIGGILYTMRFSVEAGSGADQTFVALVVAFVAGVSSSPLRFALVGLAIGLIQSIATIWISPIWNEVVIFGVLFIYVAVRPFAEERRLRLPEWRRLVARA